MDNFNEGNSNYMYKDNSQDKSKKHFGASFTIELIAIIVVAKILLGVLNRLVDSSNGIVAYANYIVSVLLGVGSIYLLGCIVVETITESKRGKARSILVTSMITLSLLSPIIYSVTLADLGFATSVIEFVGYLLLSCLGSVVTVTFIKYLLSCSKDKSNLLDVALIIILVYVAVLNYKSIIDFPIFISGNSVKYSGYCNFYTERKTRIDISEDPTGNSPILYNWTQKKLTLDTGENLSFGEGTKPKLSGDGAYKITYLPNSKHILSLAKINDKTLEKSKSDLDSIAETVNTSPLIINTFQTYNNVDYTAKCAIRITKVITKLKIMDFGKIIPVPEGLLNKDMIALKITMNFDNFSASGDKLPFGLFLGTIDADTTDKSNDSSTGVLWQNFTGGFSRSIVSREDTKIHSGSKFSLDGWVLVEKYPYEKSKHVYLEFSPLNEEKPGIKGYIDITKYLK